MRKGYKCIGKLKRDCGFFESGESGMENYEGECTALSGCPQLRKLASKPNGDTAQQTLSGSTRADAHSAKIGRLLERSCEMYGKGAIIHEHLVSDILKCARQLQIA